MVGHLPGTNNGGEDINLVLEKKKAALSRCCSDAKNSAIEAINRPGTESGPRQIGAAITKRVSRYSRIYFNTLKKSAFSVPFFFFFFFFLFFLQVNNGYFIQSFILVNGFS